MRPNFSSATSSYLAKLSEDGTQLHFSTLLDFGLTTFEEASDGTWVMCGEGSSAAFQSTPGVLWPTFATINDSGTLAKLSADGAALLWATWVDGPTRDLTLLGDDSVVLAGTTSSTTGSTLRIAADAKSLLGATPVTSGEVMEVDSDAFGNVFVAGVTTSAAFPATPGAYATQLSGNMDVFVAKFTGDLVGPQAATYLGSPQVVFGGEFPFALEVDATGVVTVAGQPELQGFPTTAGAFVGAGPATCFVTRLTPNLDRLLYSTLFASPVVQGFSPYDIWAMAMVDQGSVMIAGETGIEGLQVTPTAFQSTPGSLLHEDGFMVLLDMLPKGVHKFGSSTQSCLGEIALAPSRMPTDGDAAFSLIASGAPPSSFGVLALGSQRDVLGTTVLGVNVHLGLSGSQFVYSMPQVSPTGFAERPLPIPPGFTGQTLHAQMLFVDIGSCGSAEGILRVERTDDHSAMTAGSQGLLA